MASQNMATFHTAIFTRDGSLGLTVAECATSSAAIVQSVKPGGAAQSRRVKLGDVIWFSRMIQFVGSRAVPLPASQPILAQLLRTLKSHPGVVVRFEGHVNATCGLECRGTTGKPCKAARKVGSDMCARCPGGAYGLSKARAEAIKSFVAKCGVDVDRVYAVGFAGTRRLSDDITEEKGAVNRRVEVHMMPYAPPGRL